MLNESIIEKLEKAGLKRWDGTDGYGRDLHRLYLNVDYRKGNGWDNCWHYYVCGHEVSTSVGKAMKFNRKKCYINIDNERVTADLPELRKIAKALLDDAGYKQMKAERRAAEKAENLKLVEGEVLYHLRGRIRHWCKDHEYDMADFNSMDEAALLEWFKKVADIDAAEDVAKDREKLMIEFGLKRKPRSKKVESPSNVKEKLPSPCKERAQRGLYPKWPDPKYNGMTKEEIEQYFEYTGSECLIPDWLYPVPSGDYHLQEDSE